MKPILQIEPHADVSRPLSAIEYMHCCVGESPRTLVSAREVVVILEGEGKLPQAAWQHALDQVTRANPGARLRMRGQRNRARWESDGLPTRLRMVPDCNWDGRSKAGSEFIAATPLSFDAGPLSELIIADAGARMFVILRAHHGTMDGRGVVHFLHELFRALRNEPLLGSNANFSDVDLMRAVGARETTSKLVRAASLTGAPHGREQGDEWRRISLLGRRKNAVFRVMMAAAEFARRQRSDLPCLVAVPIDLRRHRPEINTTQNFTSILAVEMLETEDAGDFKRKLNRMLDRNMETYFYDAANLIKTLPMPWVDLLLSPRPGNFHKKRLPETLLISHLGYFKQRALSCEGFRTRSVFGLPVPGGAFCAMFGLERGLEVVVGMPKVYGNNGRLDAFMQWLEQQLEQPD